MKTKQNQKFRFRKKNLGPDTDNDTHSFGRYFRPIPNFGRTLIWGYFQNMLAVFETSEIRGRSMLNFEAATSKFGNHFWKFVCQPRDYYISPWPT